MTTHSIITEGLYHYSEREHVEVENRGGIGMGKIYIFHCGAGRDREDIEAIMIWSGRGVMDCDSRTTTDEQRGRAVRALAETEAGAKMLGFSTPEPPTLDGRISELFSTVREALKQEDAP